MVRVMVAAHAPTDPAPPTPSAMRPEPADYNYPRFHPDLYAGTRFTAAPVGAPLPRVAVERLAPPGFLRLPDDVQGRPVVLETGSLTCPVYTGKVDRMANVMRKHPEATFLVLYTREAHPGRRIGPHRTAADKRHLAARLAPEVGERRSVLVDDIDGTAHRALGALPNSVFVLDAQGTVVFRAPWNDPAAVDEALTRLARGDPLDDVEAEARFGGNPVEMVRLGLRAGWDAVADLVGSIPAMAWARWRRGGVPGKATPRPAHAPRSGAGKGALR